MHRASLAALTLAATSAYQAATPQSLSESVLSATISQSFEADSNYNLDNDPAGTTYLGDTRLGIELLQESQNHNLLFGFDTGLRALQEPDKPFEFVLASPTGGVVDYGYEAANAAFDTLLSYRQRRTTFSRDLGDFVTEEGFLPDDLTPEDQQADTREHRIDAEFGVLYGTSDRSTYGLRFTGTNIDYSDNAANLVPRWQTQISADWTLGLTPVLSTIVAAEYFYYEADNVQGTMLRIGEVDAGLVYEPDETVRVRGGVGYAQRVRRETVGGVRETTEDSTGVTLRGDVLYVQDDFQLFGDGRYTTAAPDPRFSFNVRGNYALPRGSITGRIFNRYTATSSTGTETRIAGVGLGLVRDLNQISRVGLDFAYAHQEDLDVDDPDIDRSTITATYSRDLTAVVSATVGYRYRTLVEDPTDADSHRVFFTIGRTFDTNL